MSPLVSWLFIKARSKRPSRTIFILLLFGSFPASIKRVRDESSEQRGKTANWPRHRSAENIQDAGKIETPKSVPTL